MYKADFAALLTLVAGLGSIVTDSVFKTDINSVFGPHASAVVAYTGLASAIASQVIRIYYNPSTPSTGAPHAS